MYLVIVDTGERKIRGETHKPQIVALPNHHVTIARNARDSSGVGPLWSITNFSEWQLLGLTMMMTVQYNLLNSYNRGNWRASVPGQYPGVSAAEDKTEAYHLLHFHSNFKQVIVALGHCFGADPIFTPHITAAQESSKD
jgi:hypothetical protein